MHKLYAIATITTTLLISTISANNTIYIAKSFYQNKALDKKSNKGFKLPKDIRDINSKKNRKRENNKKNRYAKDIVA